MEDFAQQLNLFNFGKETFKIDKPIRLVELFAGIGAQAKALEVLGVPFEHYKICEWAAPSIKGYNAIHIQDHTDYSANLTKEQLIDYLDGNISTDYNEPCNCKKKPESWLREVYNNCIATHNLMNIMKVKGEDLCIVDRANFCYIMTYSFPCQDLSLAGTRKGMAISQADGGTRSGLLWEVERILTELGENLPQVLLMENVPEVIGANNVEHFNKWLAKLESLGYSNYFQIMNASFEVKRKCYMQEVNKADKDKYGHPTIKPLNIIKNFILNSSKEGDLIFDAFMGSGTVAVAAKELKRNFLGFELDKDYYKMCCDRINGIDKSGQTSLLDTDFEQMNLFDIPTD